MLLASALLKSRRIESKRSNEIVRTGGIVRLQNIRQGILDTADIDFHDGRVLVAFSHYTDKELDIDKADEQIHRPRPKAFTLWRLCNHWLCK